MDAHKGVTVLDLHYCIYIHSYAGTFIDFCVYYAEISDTTDTECNVVASVLYRCMILVSARTLDSMLFYRTPVFTIFQVALTVNSIYFCTPDQNRGTVIPLSNPNYLIRHWTNH